MENLKLLSPQCVTVLQGIVIDTHGETQMYTACRSVTDTGHRVVHGVERRPC